MPFLKYVLLFGPLCLLAACDSDPGEPQPVRRQMVIFASNRGDGQNMNLWMMNPDGSGLRQLTHYADQDYFPVDLSPDGKRILFRSRASISPKSGIYLMDVDGPQPEEPLVPGWIPSGSFFPGGQQFIYEHGSTFSIFDLHDSSIVGAHPEIDRSVTPYRYILDAEVSPDGGMVCFTVEQAETDQIYLMNPDGSNPRAITPHESSVYAKDCAFSPDGENVLFAFNNRSHSNDLFWTDLESGALHPISRWSKPGDVDYHAHPAADTSGTRIFFRAWGGDFPDEESEIMAINLDGSELTRLTNDDFIDEKPVVGVVEFLE